MTVDREILLFVNIVEIGLISLLIHSQSGRQLFAFFILYKSVSVLLFRTDTNGVETASSTTKIYLSVIKFHAGNNKEIKLGSEVAVVVAAVVGYSEKVITVLLVESLDLLWCSKTVRTRGVAVKSALKHLVSFVNKSLLSFHFLPPI